MTDDQASGEILALLRQAADLDVAARECRCEAGRRLAELRRGRSFAEVARQVQLDERSVRLLVEMGAGGRVRE